MCFFFIFLFFLFFYFYVSFTMKCCQESGLLSFSMLNVNKYLQFYISVFDKMTIRRIINNNNNKTKMAMFM